MNYSANRHHHQHQMLINKLSERASERAGAKRKELSSEQHEAVEECVAVESAGRGADEAVDGFRRPCTVGSPIVLQRYDYLWLSAVIWARSAPPHQRSGYARNAAEILFFIFFFLF